MKIIFAIIVLFFHFIHTESVESSGHSETEHFGPDDSEPGDTEPGNTESGNTELGHFDLRKCQNKINGTCGSNRKCCSRPGKRLVCSGCEPNRKCKRCKRYNRRCGGEKGRCCNNLICIKTNTKCNTTGICKKACRRLDNICGGPQKLKCCPGNITCSDGICKSCQPLGTSCGGTPVLKCCPGPIICSNGTCISCQTLGQSCGRTSGLKCCPDFYCLYDSSAANSSGTCKQRPDPRCEPPQLMCNETVLRSCYFSGGVCSTPFPCPTCPLAQFLDQPTCSQCCIEDPPICIKNPTPVTNSACQCTFWFFNYNTNTKMCENSGNSYNCFSGLWESETECTTKCGGTVP